MTNIEMLEKTLPAAPLKLIANGKLSGSGTEGQ